MRSLADDVSAISRIGVIKKILDVVCRTTGLGFSAVARVTDAKWVACAVRDDISFGLLPGGELAISATFCNQIRNNGQPVVIDHVASDAVYSSHPIPAQYGFQSYISVPIHLPDGQFFGTLCAIDRQPHVVNTPATLGMFALFADLIGMHLEAESRVMSAETDLRRAHSTAADKLELDDRTSADLVLNLRTLLLTFRDGLSALSPEQTANPAVERMSAALRQFENALPGKATVIRQVTI